MLRHSSPSVFISLLALFIALGGAGYSATGGNFLLGKTNGATTPTILQGPVAGRTLQISNGSSSPDATALSLSVTNGRPPLAVNSTGKVAKLNADLIDGLDSAAFARSTSEGWHFIGDNGSPGFLNNWTNYDSAPNHPDAVWPHASYRIDQNGVVHLRGLIKGVAAETTAFRLQTPYCPWHAHPFPVLSDDGTARPSSVLGRVTVYYDDGSGCNVVVDEGIAAQFISLEGISYQTLELDRQGIPAPILTGKTLGSAHRAARR